MGKESLKARWRLSTAIVAAAMLAGGSALAFAQEATEQGDDVSIADIVVTAARREKPLNKFPLAI
jgi:outer membrane cobalamin receptor